MLTVKCPHCETALKLRQAPPSGKVKCPKCSNVVSVPTAAAGAPKPKSVAAAKAVDPDDEAFDFGRVNFPSASAATAISEFPIAENASVYEGPIPGDPLEIQEEESDDSEGRREILAPAAVPKKKRPMLLVGILAGVGVLLIVGIAAVAMLGGGDAIQVDGAVAKDTPSEGDE
jgi:ribosomal protein S27E